MDMCTGQRTTELQGFPLSLSTTGTLKIKLGSLGLTRTITQGAKLLLSLGRIFNDCCVSHSLVPQFFPCNFLPGRQDTQLHLRSVKREPSVHLTHSQQHPTNHLPAGLDTLRPDPSPALSVPEVGVTMLLAPKAPLFGLGQGFSL